MIPRSFAAALLALVLILGWAVPAGAADTSAETVVLCDPADPYYPLAEEIARAEGLPLAHTWAKALEPNPLYVIWVAAPEKLSDPVMAQAGLALRAAKELPAVGMITGSSRQAAAALWQRGVQRRQGPPAERGALYAANGEFPTVGIFAPQLVEFGPEAGDLLEASETTITPLDVDSLAGALARAGYLTFSGHGGGRSLNIAEGMQFFAKDLPALPPALVVSTSSCQTFRPWVEDSLLIGFIERGAAGYAGFVYSPMEGYTIGALNELPFRYTWPGFPAGRAAALQNQGTLQSFAGFPFYYLAGDPRMALDAQPPYQVLADAQQPGGRVISYSAVAAGLVPVRIPGGAKYAFVEVPGAGAAADGDLFFNARIQVMNARGDKYILISHPGGPFSLRLRERAPWHWRVTRPLLDSFDDVVLFLPQNGGDIMIIAAGLLALAVGAWRAWRRRGEMKGRWRRLGLACLAAGAGAALVLGSYAWLRLERAAIVNKTLSISYTWLLGAGLLAGAGMLLRSTARSRLGKALAALVGGLPGLLPGLFLLGIDLGFNLIFAMPEIGAGIYGYRMALQPLLAGGVMALVFAGVFTATLGAARG